MINKFKNGLSLLRSKLQTKHLFVVLIIIVIWLVLPLLPINGVHPFASLSMRIALSLLLVGGITGWYAIGFIQKHQLKSWTVVSNLLRRFLSGVQRVSHSTWRYSKEYCHDVNDKIKKGNRRRRLKRLPWYLVLGSESAGKKSMVKNSGLFFQQPQHIGEEALNYINDFPDFDWWFSQQAILVDVANNDAENDIARWKKFIKLLRRERKSRPFNGVVITLTLSELLTLSHKERQAFVTRITNYIRDIYSHFKAYVPIYVVFNKCDLIDGFMEFFENLSKEELDQVWGMTLPVSGCNDLQSVLNFFNREYHDLIQHLRKRVMWAFDSEKTMRGRELINAFPQQMSLFRRPIENFISELFGAVRYQQVIQVRGVYFTSCTQGQGKSNDFLLQAMSKKFQLSQPSFSRPQRIGESYFLRSLFFDVMLPEAHALGYSERRKKIRHYLYRLTLIACPIFVVATGFGMHMGYQANQKNLVSVNDYLDVYNVEINKIKQGDPSLTDTMPALKQLQNSKRLYTNTHAASLNLLFMSNYIENRIVNAEQRALHSLFLPRVAADLEKSLKNNISDQNILYANLKGYLAFSAADYTNQLALSAPMEYRWEQQYAAHPDVSMALNYLLNTALNTSVDKLPLDDTLIGRIRGQLAQVNPEQRAYGLLSLRANLGEDADIYLSTAAGNQFSTVFAEDNEKYKIPSLYTKQTYLRVFRPQYQAIADEVAQDNHDIGLAAANDSSSNSSSIEASLQTTYNQQYQKTWNTALENIHVKPFSSLNDAVIVLNELVDTNSPLSRMLSVVYDNTAGISEGTVKIQTVYRNVNSYTENAGWGTNWHDTDKVLQQLRDYLVKLQQSQNQDQASFNVAKAVIEGKAANPMKQLAEIANRSPQPVRRWLMAIANNCWQIIIRGAHQQMNSAWNDKIMPAYNSGMRDRFPLNETAHSSVSMDSFNQLFAPNGALDAYFNTYIKPFVNVEANQWVPYSEQGLTIELSQSNIDLFTQAAKIRSQFFPGGAKTAAINMVVKPLTLDKNATSIEFVVGDKTIDYSHGPQDNTSISWPLPFNNQDSRIVITTFNADQYGHSSGGPWSLFRMFHYGLFKQTDEAGTFEFDLDFKGHTASYQITGPSDMSLYTLKNLVGFSLPQVIAPTIQNNATTLKKKG